MEKVVLAYSGGLDTSIILTWLKMEKGFDVVAFVADIGQGDTELGTVKETALATGASKVYVEDLREEFVRDFVFPVIKANAVYEGSYLLGTSMARPLIAKKQVAIAQKENARFVAHGATGKGNDQVRFELTYLALNPHLQIIAPWREWNLKSRTALMEYARKHTIPVPVTTEKPYSSDRNIFHISFEGGILEDPWQEPSEDMFVLSRSPEKAPDTPVYIELEFHEGEPVALNGQKMRPFDLLSELNKIGGEHGIGRVDIVENRYVGMKSRGVYETPGGTILHIGHRAIESITMDREVLHLRDSLMPRYAELVYYGYWYSPEMNILRSLMDDIQKDVSGVVRLKLYKGNCIVSGRKSDTSLYREDYATFEEEDVYRQQNAEGFIKLNALRLQIKALQERAKKTSHKDAKTQRK